MSTNKDPVSQVDIAEALGLSQSTVSLALKGNKQVAENTRELVGRKAKELGYILDPKMGALTSYRQSSSVQQVVPTLAWITNFPTKSGWKKGHNLKCFEGAKRKAKQLGFEIKELWLGGTDVSPYELQKRLVDQGIRGVIVAAQESLESEIKFNFDSFSSVSIGYLVKSPILHSVDTYALGNIQKAVTRLTQRGYRRIGLAVSEIINKRADGAFYGGFLSRKELHRMNILPLYKSEDFEEDSFERWFKRWNPDALIAWGDYLFRIEIWMNDHSITVGKDIAIAGLDLEERTGEYAGIYQQSELIGELAVTTLASHLNHFDYGVPKNPSQTLVDGLWVDGKSAPDKRNVGID